MKKRALISLSDKSGVVEFAKELTALGFEIISTGGTEKTIRDAGISVINISDITGFPECLDGRVKTLHPNVHAGILAMRDNSQHMEQLEKLNIETIDLVAINLYPFKATISKPDCTLEQAIENIDIGGPTMLRAAAKNWGDVAVIVDPRDYGRVIDELKDGNISRETKFELCLKVFEHTAAYDALIAQYLAKQIGKDFLPETLTLTFEKVQSMRYGENPHQGAAFYKQPVEFAQNGLASATQLHGKELSFNNINDANGALDLLKEFDGTKAVAIAVKHANPCGVGVGDNIFDAYKKAHDADPMSIFGGIVALNRIVDAQTAEEMGKIFLEVIIAPDYTEQAVEILGKKKNIRLLKLENCAVPCEMGTIDMKKVVGGLLVQERDNLIMGEELTVVTERAPTKEEMDSLILAWKIVKHTKSNGIALAKGEASVGIGPGQTNRITALELAIKYAGENSVGSVMGSDAFFPFDDCVDAAHKAGVTAIIQPGGSVKDQLSIDACNKYGIAMVFTGMRHFKH